MTRMTGRPGIARSITRTPPCRSPRRWTPLPRHCSSLMFRIPIATVLSQPGSPPEERRRYDAWTPFHERFENVLVPNTRALLGYCREVGIECMFARIAALKRDGRDRSLSQKLPGWNNILLPHRDHASQVIPDLAPLEDEIVVEKTTDSAVTGTNLRLLLGNMGIRTVICVGVFTDQCVSSTVRSLADESFSRCGCRGLLRCRHGCAASPGAGNHQQHLLHGDGVAGSARPRRRGAGARRLRRRRMAGGLAQGITTSSIRRLSALFSLVSLGATGSLSP